MPAAYGNHYAISKPTSSKPIKTLMNAMLIAERRRELVV